MRVPYLYIHKHLISVHRFVKGFKLHFIEDLLQGRGRNGERQKSPSSGRCRRIHRVSYGTLISEQYGPYYMVQYSVTCQGHHLQQCRLLHVDNTNKLSFRLQILQSFLFQSLKPCHTKLISELMLLNQRQYPYITITALHHTNIKLHNVELI